VTALYAFVRVADNFVDRQPQDAEGFRNFRDASRRALAGEWTGDPIIDSFAELSPRAGFERATCISLISVLTEITATTILPV
jgi:15-cis-phytoene synthase